MGGGSSKRLRAAAPANRDADTRLEELTAPKAVEADGACTPARLSSGSPCAPPDLRPEENPSAACPRQSSRSASVSPGRDTPSTSVSPRIVARSPFVAVRSPFNVSSPLRALVADSLLKETGVGGDESDKGDEDEVEFSLVREWAAATAVALRPVWRGGARVRLWCGEAGWGAGLEGEGAAFKEAWSRAAEQRWRELNPGKWAGSPRGTAGSSAALSEAAPVAPAEADVVGVPFSLHLGCLGLPCGLWAPSAKDDAARGQGGQAPDALGGEEGEAVSALLLAWIDPAVSRAALLARGLAPPGDEAAGGGGGGAGALGWVGDWGREEWAEQIDARLRAHAAAAARELAQAAPAEQSIAPVRLLLAAADRARLLRLSTSVREGLRPGQRGQTAAAAAAAAAATAADAAAASGSGGEEGWADEGGDPWRDPWVGTGVLRLAPAGPALWVPLSPHAHLHPAGIPLPLPGGGAALVPLPPGWMLLDSWLKLAHVRERLAADPQGAALLSLSLALQVAGALAHLQRPGASAPARPRAPTAREARGAGRRVAHRGVDPRTVLVREGAGDEGLKGLWWAGVEASLADLGASSVPDPGADPGAACAAVGGGAGGGVEAPAGVLVLPPGCAVGVGVRRGGAYTLLIEEVGSAAALGWFSGEGIGGRTRAALRGVFPRGMLAGGAPAGDGEGGRSWAVCGEAGLEECEVDAGAAGRGWWLDLCEGRGQLVEGARGAWAGVQNGRATPLLVFWWPRALSEAEQDAAAVLAPRSDGACGAAARDLCCLSGVGLRVLGRAAGAAADGARAALEGLRARAREELEGGGVEGARGEEEEEDWAGRPLEGAVASLAAALHGAAAAAGAAAEVRALLLIEAAAPPRAPRGAPRARAHAGAAAARESRAQLLLRAALPASHPLALAGALRAGLAMADLPGGAPAALEALRDLFRLVAAAPPGVAVGAWDAPPPRWRERWGGLALDAAAWVQARAGDVDGALRSANEALGARFPRVAGSAGGAPGRAPAGERWEAARRARDRAALLLAVGGATGGAQAARLLQEAASALQEHFADAAAAARGRRRDERRLTLLEELALREEQEEARRAPSHASAQSAAARAVAAGLLRPNPPRAPPSAPPGGGPGGAEEGLLLAEVRAEEAGALVAAGRFQDALAAFEEAARDFRALLARPAVSLEPFDVERSSEVQLCLRGSDRATALLVQQALSGMEPQAWAAEEARREREARAAAARQRAAEQRAKRELELRHLEARGGRVVEHRLPGGAVVKIVMEGAAVLEAWDGMVASPPKDRMRLRQRRLEAERSFHAARAAVDKDPPAVEQARFLFATARDAFASLGSIDMIEPLRDLETLIAAATRPAPPPAPTPARAPPAEALLAAFDSAAGYRDEGGGRESLGAEADGAEANADGGGDGASAAAAGAAGEGKGEEGTTVWVPRALPAERAPGGDEAGEGAEGFDPDAVASPHGAPARPAPATPRAAPGADSPGRATGGGRSPMRQWAGSPRGGGDGWSRWWKGDMAVLPESLKVETPEEAERRRQIEEQIRCEAEALREAYLARQAAAAAAGGP